MQVPRNDSSVTTLALLLAVVLFSIASLVGCMRQKKQNCVSTPTGTGAEAATPAPADPELLALGSKLYVERGCAGCHGATGRGDGRGAPSLIPRPRDFSRGMFRFGTTSGPLPSDADLARTIVERIWWSSMPAFPDLSDREVAGLVAHVKALSRPADSAAGEGHFDKSPVPVAIVVPPRPPHTEALMAQGKAQFEALCASCHGKTGDGDGPAAKDMKDAWGVPVPPRDLRSPIYKWGASERDVFIAISRGIPGTPMPGFEALDAGKRWAIASWVVAQQHWPAGIVERGELLFRAAGCVSCHGPGGRGGVEDPNYIKGTVPRLDGLAENMMLDDPEDAEIFIDLLGSGRDPRTLQEPPEGLRRWPVILAQYAAVRNLLDKGNPAGHKDPAKLAPPLNMPAWRGLLDDREANALIAWLISILPPEGAEGAAPATATAVDKGT